jgi:hypothetical protein
MIVQVEDRIYIKCDRCRERKIRIKSRCLCDIQAGLAKNGWDRHKLIQGWQDNCMSCYAERLREKARRRAG